MMKDYACTQAVAQRYLYLIRSLSNTVKSVSNLLASNKENSGYSGQFRGIWQHGCSMEVAKLKVELGLTAVRKAGRYMDRP